MTSGLGGTAERRSTGLADHDYVLLADERIGDVLEKLESLPPDAFHVASRNAPVVIFDAGEYVARASRPDVAESFVEVVAILPLAGEKL